MTKFLAAVLSVIAVGVLLIAYGLLGPRTAAFAPAEWQGIPGYQLGANPGFVHGYPAGALQAVPVTSYQLVAAPSAGQRMVYAAPGAYAQPLLVQESPRPAAQRTVVVRRDEGRSWKKAALLIGGSTATGAGVGAIFGGKKGALVGAAIGGGASTLYESTK